MKCRICNKKADIQLRSYNINLCRDCYPKFYERLVERSIKKYKIIKENERILVAVSGGKDSVALAHTLAKLHKFLKFNFEIFHINLGLGEYSEKCEKAAKELGKKLEIKTNIVKLTDYGFAIPEIRVKKRCHFCGVAKRYLMNRYARENGFDVIATGHTSDDIVKFFFKNWLAGNFEWSEKFLPRIEGFDSKVVTRVKPLFDRSGDENRLYVKILNLPFVEEKCPFAPKKDKWKEIVEEIEKRSPGFKRSFVLNLVKYLNTEKNQEKEKYQYCENCGEIASDKLCAFCKILKNLKSPKNY